MRNVTATLAVAMCLAAFPLQAIAQLSAPAPRQTIGVNVWCQTSAVAYDPLHARYLIVCTSGDVVGVFVNRLGQPIAPPFLIGPGGGSSSIIATDSPRLVYSPDVGGGVGGFLVFWTRYEPAANNQRSVRARGVAYPGVLLGSEGLIFDPTVSPAPGPFENLTSVSAGYSPTSHVALISLNWFTVTQIGVIGSDAHLIGSLHNDSVVSNASIAESFAWNPRTDEFGLGYIAGVIGGYQIGLAWFSTAGQHLGTTELASHGVSASDQLELPTVTLNAITGNYLAIWEIDHLVSTGTIPSVAPSRPSDLFATEVDDTGRVIASGHVGLTDTLGMAVAFNDSSGTIAVVGVTGLSQATTVIHALELNGHGEPISPLLTVSGNVPFPQSPPHLASGAGANGWLVTVAGGGSVYALPISTTSTNGGPRGPALADLCGTPDPFVLLGGGVCVYGGWVPPDHPLAQRESPPAPTPAPTAIPNNCTTPDPFVAFGGGTCLNGGWYPPNSNPMPTLTPIPTPTPTPTPSPLSCTTPDPFSALGGGACANGGWYPPGMTPPPLIPGGCTTPDPFVAFGGGACVNGGWHFRGGH